MALPINTYTRFTAGTNVREDLIDKITMTNSESTPIIAAMGRDTAENTYTEWQRDNLRAPNKDNAALDGDDATGTAKVPPTRIGNVTQIYQDTVVVSGRAEVVKKAGMASALAYYCAKAYKELQRDMEATVVSSNPAVLGSGAVSPKAGGLGVLLFTNAQHGVGGSTTAHTSGAPVTAPVAGANRAFTEALLKAAVSATYVISGEVPPAVYMSPFHKGIFSTFPGIAQNRQDVAPKKQARIVGGADIYTSDFGNLEIVPHYIMAGSTSVYGLSPDQGDIAYLRPFKKTMLGVSGDNTRAQVLVDATVRMKSEQSSFKIADLIPA